MSAPAVATALDLGAIRQAIVDGVAVALPALNGYTYPDPQVEYPALVLPTFDDIVLHASVGCYGVIIVWTFELLVGKGEVESAVIALEKIAFDLANVLEAIDSAPWAQLIVHRISNVRDREQAGALSADLVVELHA